MNIQVFLSNKFHQALIAAGAPTDCKAQVHQSAKEQFGHYQVNGVISIAKQLRIPPQQLAEKVLQQLNIGDIASKIEIASHGFINIFINNKWLARHIDYILSAPKLGLMKVKPQTIVIDYSAPNLAKEMHVGHLRSTIIGDAVARTLEFLGHNVIRTNHVGDWGTQFGMLIAYLDIIQNDISNEIVLSDMEEFYRKAKKYYDEDSEFAEKARKYVVKLQSGDNYCKAMWRKLVNITIAHNQIIYNRLNVTLTENDVIGESYYNAMLPGIVADLKAKGLAVESEGATVVFLDAYQNKKGNPMGIVVQKKDGGYLYTTTDIACAKYRYETLGADRILYYTDSRQHQHLMQAWSIARKAGYLPEHVSLEHHLFGMILGQNGKPFKTRDGGTVKLSDLLDEAIARAKKLIINKNPKMPIEEITQVARVVGIGAVKYADLSKHRATDYIFDWDKMLVFTGNTAPYIQYAYTRILSIFKHSKIDENSLILPLVIHDKHEIALAIRMLQFEEALHAVTRDGTPHIMCSYLYDLAGIFSSFYQHCQILNTHNEIVQQSRLKLSLLTSRILKTGLNTLGIETVERM
ncbi:arginyl-tRNA synthetase [Serratia symbiotica str. 'Cinara cedri']|nr:arginyl-tRNA synthetase [Serratia symbiotica str. 'Cinara cedri']